MAYEFQTISLRDIGGGIDQLSSEDSIKPSFVENLLNVDPISEGYGKRRVGYQSYAGWVPLRVTKLEYVDGSTNNIIVGFDSSITVENISSSPVLLYGRTSSSNTANDGDFKNNADTCHWYTGFRLDQPKTFQVGTNTLSLPFSEHGIDSEYIDIVVGTSDSLANQSNTLFTPDQISINQSTKEISIAYTNSTGAAFSGYVWLIDKTPVSGAIYSSKPSGLTAAASGVPTTLTIASATHGLLNTNIIAKAYQDDGTSNILIEPESIVIKPNGNVEVTVVNNSGSSINFFVILSATETANYNEGTVNANSSSTITLSGLTGNFINPAIYLESTIGGDKELVLPDSVSVDATTSTATISFTNSSSNSAFFYVFFEYGTLKSSVIRLTGTALSNPANAFSDAAPQLTLWGLPHSSIYGTNPAGTSPGWVNHLDSYKSAGISKLVCGLGGNLFIEADRDTYSSIYNMPLLYPNINQRVSGDHTIAPAFFQTGTSSNRTRGYLEFDCSSINKASIQTVEWDSSVNRVKYTLSMPNLTLHGDLLDIISADTGMEDYLTVSGTLNSRNSGEFRIWAFSNNLDNTISVWVTNPSVNSSDWDEVGTGEAGIFTDQITLNGNSPFLAGDLVIAETISESDDVEVIVSASTKVVVKNILAETILNNGLKLIGKRSSRVIPLRTITETSSVTNLVPGDMLSVTGLGRQLRIKSINPNSSDLAVTITGNALTGTATATLGAGSTADLGLGSRVLILRAGVYSGVHQITGIPSSTTFTFSSSLTDAGIAGTLKCCTVEVDEEYPDILDSIDNSIAYSVEKRWVPVEAPTDNWNLTKATYIKHFNSSSFDSQVPLRSVMAADTLYLTNGEDPVMKMDGTNLYRAGLPRWQPGLFAALDTTPETGGTIDIDNLSITYTSISGVRFTLSAGDEKNFQAGDLVRDNFDNTDYTVVAIDSTANAVIVNKAISTGARSSNTISKVYSFKYYFRLNMVDTNGNLVASAVTGSDDHVVKLVEDTQVRLRLVGLPAFDNWDYDKLEVQIYRTKANASAPFYLLATLPISFTETEGYITYNDGNSDDTLKDFDKISTALEGGELGQQWEEPLRAKYCTSADNRLVLAHLKDYPELDIRLVNTGTTVNAASLAGKIFTFRKDNTSTATTTDSVNTFRYELVNTGKVSVSPFDISLSAPYIIVNSTAHGLNVGNWVYLFHDSTEDNHILAQTGWFQIHSKTTDTFTIHNSSLASLPTASTFTVNAGTNVVSCTGHTFVNGESVKVKSTATLPAPLSDSTTYYIISAATNTFKLSLTRGGTEVDISDAGTGTHSVIASSLFDSWIKATDGKDIPVWLGADSNYGMTNGNRSVTGPYEFIAMRRLGNAINSSMRMVDTELTGQSSFKPWMIANAGNEYSVGQLVVRFPTILSTTPEVKLPAFTSFNLFVNNIKRASEAEVSATVKLYPSRLIVSYPNFPELMDNPRATTDSQSKSAIDINSADGQEITGVIPFFGESAFGGSQKAGIIVVFKTNSIYLVDLSAKDNQESAVQKIESQGLGCTAPYSIAATRNGIIFANESGLFRLTSQLTVEPVGQKLDRYWNQTVNRDQLGICQGHHYGIGKQYKLSVPVSGQRENSEVAVYDHTREYQGQDRFGSWTLYNQHPATGWANLGADEFFSSTGGDVFKRRRAGDNSDYRDDSEAYTSTILLRAMDFGNAGIRKIIGSIIAHFRTSVDSSDIHLYSSEDFNPSFSELDTFSVDSNERINTIKFSVNKRKATYIQLKLETSTIDKPMELTGVDFRVAGLTDTGITEARQTSES